MLKKPRHYLLASLSLLAIALAPAVYAAGLKPPEEQIGSGASGTTQTSAGIEFSSDRVEGGPGGARLVLTGNVRLRLPASVSLQWTADSVTQRDDGAIVLEGAVSMTAADSHISAERAILTQSDNGVTLISMDRALMVRG